MKKIWTFIKKVLKRILPPTVHVFMREVNGLHGAMAAREANLSHQLGVAKAETQSLMKQIEEQQTRRLDRMEEQQGKRLDRLSDLFESANRENLRLFFDAREERKEMDERYAQLAEEMKKLQTRQAELERKLAENQSAVEKKLAASQTITANKLAESQTLLVNGQKRLEETVSAVRKASVEGARSASEGVWADIFNQTVADSSWLLDKTFSPGRWAVGYPYLYVMYRVLNETKPKRILELGLGQSTRMIAQYAAAHEGVEHYVVEQDSQWTEFFSKEIKMGENTHVFHLPVVEEHFLDDEITLVYSGFEEAIKGMKFDFISCDGPAHSRSEKYRRVEIAKLVPDHLENSFFLMLDDYNVKECQNTWEITKEKMKAENAPFSTGIYEGQKKVAVLCSEDNKFLCSL